MSKIFGGSKSKQQSTSSNTSQSLNQAYPTLNTSFQPVLADTGVASNSIQNLLGLGTDPAAAQKSFQDYQDSTGYQFQMDQGLRALNSNAATKGLYDSGATAKALLTYGQNTAKSSYNDYLGQLFNFGNLGTSAGQVLSGAGNTSSSQGQSQMTGSSSSSQGIGKTLGAAASLAMMASDRRLKKNITKLYERPDGLGVYQFHYINDRGPYIGVMADEVEKFRPDALGPIRGGYATVDYSKLGEL